MGKSPWYSDPEDGFDIELTLEREEVDNLIKAKNALSDVDNMLIQTNKNLDGTEVCEFLFGDNTGFSNKIEYQLQGIIKDSDVKLPFNSDIFNLVCNSPCFSDDSNKSPFVIDSNFINLFVYNTLMY